MMEEELCTVCSEPTGRCGEGDDSLYRSDGTGPYCENCFTPTTVLENCIVNYPTQSAFDVLRDIVEHLGIVNVQRSLYKLGMLPEKLITFSFTVECPACHNLYEANHLKVEVLRNKLPMGKCPKCKTGFIMVFVTQGYPKYLFNESSTQTRMATNETERFRILAKESGWVEVTKDEYWRLNQVRNSTVGACIAAINAAHLR